MAKQKKITREQLTEFSVAAAKWVAQIEALLDDESKWDSNGVLKADDTVPPGPPPPGGPH